MGNGLAAVVWATLASVAGTGIGGLAGCFGGNVRGILPAVLGFASGLMTAIVCFGLMPEAVEAYGISTALIGMAAGIATVWLAASFLPGEEGGLDRTSFLVLAGSPSFYLALAIMPVMGFSIMRHNASANTLIQVLIPDEYRGRIMALYSMTVVGIGPFGSLATGALAGRYGARVTVMCGGILCIIAAAVFRLYVRKLPELR
jgi:hypothetical protein